MADVILMRSALHRALGDATEVIVVGEGSGAAARIQIRSLRPDVAVVMCTDPNVGLAACRALRDDHPSTRRLLVGMSSDAAMMHAAIDAGADGLVSADMPIDEFVGALMWLHERGTYIDPRFAPVLLRQPRPLPADDRDRLALLTDTERTILDLVAHGATNRQIGKRLHLSEWTARNKVSVILRKLGVATRVEAAVLATSERHTRPA